MNRFSSLVYVLHCDVKNAKKKKEKRKRHEVYNYSEHVKYYKIFAYISE